MQKLYLNKRDCIRDSATLHTQRYYFPTSFLLSFKSSSVVCCFPYYVRHASRPTRNKCSGYEQSHLERAD
jgi:hypothetical protein